MKKILYIVGGIIVLIVIIVAFTSGGGEKVKTQKEITSKLPASVSEGLKESQSELEPEPEGSEAGPPESSEAGFGGEPEVTPEETPVENVSADPQPDLPADEAGVDEPLVQTAEEPEILPESEPEPSVPPAPAQSEESKLDSENQAESKTESKQEVTYLVTKVIDGDTIAIKGGQVIRYIGIDTPETVHPSKPIECFSAEASNKNKELIEGKRVKLEKDVSETDKYGRLLRYVWIGDIFVNDYLVRQGYAYAFTYPPDVKYSDQFIEAQREAKENNRGLWTSCKSLPEPEPQPEPEPEPEPEPPVSTGDIICSYNAYNCPDFSTHAEAQRAYEACGGISNDIHRLDRDKDGLACESLP